MSAPDANGWLPAEEAPRDGTNQFFWNRKHGIVVGYIPSRCAHFKKPEAYLAGDRSSKSFRPTYYQPVTIGDPVQS